MKTLSTVKTLQIVFKSYVKIYLIIELIVNPFGHI